MTIPPASLALLNELAEAMHMIDANSSRRIIPRSSYSKEYNRHLIRQAEAALSTIKKYYDLHPLQLNRTAGDGDE